MMNIACDARALAGPLTGVGTWTAQVMGGLSGDGFARVQLAAPRPLNLPGELVNRAVSVLPPPRMRIPGTLWLHTMLAHQLARAGADVFVGSLAVIPRRCPIPSVAMIHDLTPRTHPHRHTLANRFCFNAYLEESLAQARAVVVNSAATAAVLLDTFPWVRHRVRHIGLGVDELFSPPPPGDDGAATRQRFTKGRPYILHLGTIEPRKGIADLVAAWERLHQLVGDAPDLVIAGGSGWGTAPILRRIASSPLIDRIHLPGYVQRHEARDLLRHAALFVLASEAEGFGLPVAEAVSCGTPCVVTDIPALREVAADAAVYAQPRRPESLAHAIADALSPATARALRTRAAERAPQLRWQPIVHAWAKLLGEVIEEA